MQREELLREEIEELLGGKQKAPEPPNGAVEVAPTESPAPPAMAPTHPAGSSDGAS